jgi:hypothetical protein
MSETILSSDSLQEISLTLLTTCGRLKPLVINPEFCRESETTGEKEKCLVPSEFLLLSPENTSNPCKYM